MAAGKEKWQTCKASTNGSSTTSSDSNDSQQPYAAMMPKAAMTGLYY